MKNKYDMLEIKQGWQDMYRERTCPGYKVLCSADHAAEVAEHRKRCRICAAETLEELESWKELGESVQDVLPELTRPQPAVGQVWSLQSAMGGWDDLHRYINPPLVMVLGVYDDVDGVRVAQLFDMPELALGDDVELQGYPGYAEPWNTYALRIDDLDGCWGRVSGETVQRVLALAEADDDTHGLQEDTIPYFFRQLELEVGARMAIQALPDLVEREERGGLPECVEDPKQVRAKVLAFEPRVKLPETDDPLALLATMELPEELLKYAASDTEHEVRYNQLTLNPEEFNSLRTGLARLENQGLVDDAIHVEGWLDTDASSGVLLAWWKVGETHVMGEVDLDVDGEYFEVDFKGRSAEDFSEGELVLLLLRKADGTTH